MSTRIVGMHVAAVLALLSTVAAAQPVSPFPPGTLVTPGPTELDKAYQYSMIGQELAYAKIRENAGGKPDGASAESEAADWGRLSLFAASGSRQGQSSVLGLQSRCFVALPAAILARRQAGGRGIQTVGCPGPPTAA